MFCKKCGAELCDGTKFCPKCGEALEEEVKKTVVDTPEADSLATSVLTFGIIGVVLLWIFPPVGIVFSYLAIKKFKQYKELSAIPSTKANVGNILATVGLVINIISSVLMVLSIVFFIFYFIFIVGLSATSVLAM